MLGAYHEWTNAMPNGELEHPACIHLIDADGRIQEIYRFRVFDPRQGADRYTVARALSRILSFTVRIQYSAAMRDRSKSRAGIIGQDTDGGRMLTGHLHDCVSL